jgi:tetratricopeptide (TPR) repeat protein
MPRIIWCGILIFMVQASSLGGPSEHSAAEDLAHRIWYEAPAQSEQAQLCRQLSRCVATSNWRAAIGVAERLAQRMPRKWEPWEKESPWEWRVAIGELYLYDLQPRRGIDEFTRVLRAVPAAGQLNRGRSGARQSASYAMARAKAELGDFREATRWLKQAPDEYWSGCGNYMEGEQLWAHPVLLVWEKAQLPYARALREIEAIRRGNFRPLKVYLSPKTQADEWQRRHAVAEAALILGELHLRHGERDKALSYFNQAATSQYDLARIAQSYIYRLERGKYVDASLGQPTALLKSADSCRSARWRGGPGAPPASRRRPARGCGSSS